MHGRKDRTAGRNVLLVRDGTEVRIGGRRRDWSWGQRKGSGRRLFDGESHARLAYPIADLLLTFRGQTSESQAACLSRLIDPRNFAVGFDFLLVLGEPETDRALALNWSDGVEAKPSLRDIQHNAAVIRIEIDIDDAVKRRSRGLAAFRPCSVRSHWIESGFTKEPPALVGVLDAFGHHPGRGLHYIKDSARSIKRAD